MIRPSENRPAPERAFRALSVHSAGRLRGPGRELGITELVVHWPVPDSIFANDLAVFERIATEGLAQLG